MIIKIITLCIRKSTFKLISLNNTNLIHHLNCKGKSFKTLINKFELQRKILSNINSIYLNCWKYFSEIKLIIIKIKKLLKIKNSSEYKWIIILLLKLYYSISIILSFSISQIIQNSSKKKKRKYLFQIFKSFKKKKEKNTLDLQQYWNIPKKNFTLKRLFALHHKKWFCIKIVNKYSREK